MSFHRYPFLAHEILNCEISQLLEKFFEAPEPKKKEPKEKSKGDDGDEDGVCTVDLGASSVDVLVRGFVRTEDYWSFFFDSRP